MPTTLVLVRHGEARAGVEHVVGGPIGCKGLTERGRAQAHALGQRLARVGFAPDVVLASILRRAIETAELALPGAAIVADCDYCELHVGEADGLAIAEYNARYGDIDRLDPDAPMAPGGESMRSFDDRVRRATAELLETHRDETVILFTHGGFVTSATNMLIGSGPLFDNTVGWYGPKNTSLTVFVNDGPEGRWRLDRYNDTAHLGDEYIPA